MVHPTVFLSVVPGVQLTIERFKTCNLSSNPSPGFLVFQLLSTLYPNFLPYLTEQFLGNDLYLLDKPDALENNGRYG